MEGERNEEGRLMSRKEFFVAVWGLFFLVFFAIAALCGGCCNITMRSESTKQAPYFIQPHPYCSTVNVWNDCICAPWHLDGGTDAIWPAIVTLTYPFWIIDEVCEVALDTVFLPIDATYYCCKGK